MRMIFAVATALVCLVSTADARWSPKYANADPKIQAWYNHQHNAQGATCCDESDGHPYYGDYKLNDDGSVTVSLNGKPYKLDAYMVLKTPNPTGHTVWWYIDVGGGIESFCFAPGPLG